MTISKPDGDTETETRPIDPIQISTQFATFIRGDVARVYGFPVDELEVAHDEAFLDEKAPDTVFCMVYHESGAPYGVAVELSDQGDPVRYRCQQIQPQQ